MLAVSCQRAKNVKLVMHRAVVLYTKETRIVWLQARKLSETVQGVDLGKQRGNWCAYLQPIIVYQLFNKPVVPGGVYKDGCVD